MGGGGDDGEDVEGIEGEGDGWRRGGGFGNGGQGSMGGVKEDVGLGCWVFKN